MTKPHYHRDRGESRHLDAGLDIDSALDAFYRSKWKEKVNKILLIEEPERTESEVKKDE